MLPPLRNARGTRRAQSTIPDRTPRAADQCAARINRHGDLGLTGTGGDEAVAPARHGLDEGRHRRVVTKRATDLQDDHLENTVADVGLCPPSPQQLLLGNQLPAVFDQPAQDRKCLRGEGDDLVPTPQPLAGEIQAKVTEREASIRFHRRRTRFLTALYHQYHFRSIVGACRAPYLRVHGTEPQAPINHATGTPSSLIRSLRTMRRRTAASRRTISRSVGRGAATMAPDMDNCYGPL